MLLYLLKPLGHLLNYWKWRQDRKIHGIWIGDPPVLVSHTELLSGDVLFCGESASTKNGNPIRIASAGEYVHCALYVGDGQIVDVTPSGARSITIHDFLRIYSYLAVARCPGNIKYPTRRDRIANFANDALNGEVSGYNFVGAGLVVFRELSDLRRFNKLWRKKRIKVQDQRQQRKRMFCSEFVVEAYIDCGYIPKNDPYLTSNRRTPSGLAEENVFEFIGYMSNHGWDGISENDHFLGGCSWILKQAKISGMGTAET